MGKNRKSSSAASGSKPVVIVSTGSGIVVDATSSRFLAPASVLRAGSREQIDNDRRRIIDGINSFLDYYNWKVHGIRRLFEVILLGMAIGVIIGATLAGYPSYGFIRRIHQNSLYRLVTLESEAWDDLFQSIAELAQVIEHSIEAETYAPNPSHPRVFAVLKEAVMREQGGYVHHDLGLLLPAPSGAARGLGMVHDRFTKCQVRCFPGTSEEKIAYNQQKTLLYESGQDFPPIPTSNTTIYRQEEILIRVPLNFQMTRSTALDAILPLIPGDVQGATNLEGLGDAALLVLQLAHERGVGRYSRWIPYIASLPLEPSCGYNERLRPQMLDAIHVLQGELGLDVSNWDKELVRAGEYAEKIVEGLSKDYGEYLLKPEGVSAKDNIAWALCQVASRATAGSPKHGSLRLIPFIDLINHDVNAGGFTELDGTESFVNGDYAEATESDSGSFVVRSLRFGRRNALKRGQELLATYNVPQYTALDWFVSLGFVPPERWHNWQKIDAVLPRVQHHHYISEVLMPTDQDVERRLPELLQRLKDAEL
jgi:hypothetical protein